MFCDGGFDIEAGAVDAVPASPFVGSGLWCTLGLLLFSVLLQKPDRLIADRPRVLTGLGTQPLGKVGGSTEADCSRGRRIGGSCLHLHPFGLDTVLVSCDAM